MSHINPRVDIAFKKIFGVDENKDLLISLINSVVSEEDQVESVTLLNPYNPKNFKNDKLSILDIKAKGTHGHIFNIEIQVNDEADYDKRALYYWGKAYTEQLKNGDDYALLNKTIGIHILNFTSIPEESKYHNVFRISEKESGLVYFKDLELHTIELKKFLDNADEKFIDFIPKIQNSLDMWAAFLTRHDVMNRDALPPALNTPELKKALDVLSVMNFGDDEREAYETHLKWLRAEASALKKVEAKAKAAGRAEGRAEGKIEEKVEVAKRLIAKRVPLEDVCEITELNLVMVQELALNPLKK